MSTFTTRLCRPAFAAAFACLAAFGPAHAESSDAGDGILVELNRMEDQDPRGCRLSLVFRNGTEGLLDTFKIDLVMFGQDDVIARRLIVDASPLRPQKTTVKLFDVGDLPCGGIATVLVNDLPGCTLDGDGRAECLDRLKVRSKAPAALVK